jgi:nitric oxide dioxygenase
MVMTPTATQIRLLKDSVPVIRERFEPASLDFYANLFSIAPDTRSLFREDLAGQGMKYMSTLLTLVDLLDNPEAFENELDDLAHSHSTVGVRAEHYAPMGSALLVTLGESLGRHFTEELRVAWRSAYEHVAAEMQARAKGA